MEIICYYISLNNLSIIIIDRITRVRIDNTYNLKIPTKVYISILIIGFPMLFFIKQIKQSKIDNHKLGRYNQLKYIRNVVNYQVFANDKYDIEYKKLDRYFKLKNLNKEWKIFRVFSVS